MSQPQTSEKLKARAKPHRQRHPVDHNPTPPRVRRGRSTPLLQHISPSMTLTENIDGRTGVSCLPVPKPLEFTLSSGPSQEVRKSSLAYDGSQPAPAIIEHRQSAQEVKDGTRPHRQRSRATIIVETHNARHLLRTDGEGTFTQQLLIDMQQSRVFAYLLQEVEQKGDQSGAQVACDHTLILSGSVSNSRQPRPQARSGRAQKRKAPREEPGLAGILLSPTASRSWDGVTRRFGPRIVAARCKLPHRSRGKSHVLLVSAYAPHSGRHASEHTEFLEHLGDCVAAAKSTDLLQIGIVVRSCCTHAAATRTRSARSKHS